MGSTAEAGILDDWLRRIGLVCQVVGFLLAAAGVADLRRRHSDRPGIVATVRQGLDRARSAALARVRSLLAALRRYGQHAGRQLRDRRRALANVIRRVLRRPQRYHVEGVAAATLRVTATAGRATVTIGPPPPVDERVAALEARLAELERQLDSERDRVDDRIRDLASAGLRAEAWGIGLFLVGTVLSTIPDELADLLRGIA